MGCLLSALTKAHSRHVRRSLCQVPDVNSWRSQTSAYLVAQVTSAGGDVQRSNGSVHLDLAARPSRTSAVPSPVFCAGSSIPATPSAAAAEALFRELTEAVVAAAAAHSRRVVAAAEAAAAAAIGGELHSRLLAPQAV